MTFVQTVEKSVCILRISWEKHGRQLMWSVATFLQGHPLDIGTKTFVHTVDIIFKSVFHSQPFPTSKKVS
jgi:hypothetical protein